MTPSNVAFTAPISARTLNCESPETATQSLAGIVGLSVSALLALLLSAPDDADGETLLASLPSSRRDAVDGAFFFHATRTVGDGSSYFDRGVRTRSDIEPELWNVLWSLAGPVSEELKSYIRTNVCDLSAQYATQQSASALNEGPFGCLVLAEVAYGEADGFRTAGGERLRDIAQAIQAVTGVDVLQKFVASSVPYVVQFYGTASAWHVGQAAEYIRNSLRYPGDSHGLYGGYVGPAVPARHVYRVIRLDEGASA